MEKIKNLKNKFINTCKKIKEEHLISKYRSEEASCRERV